MLGIFHTRLSSPFRLIDLKHSLELPLPVCRNVLCKNNTGTPCCIADDGGLIRILIGGMITPHSAFILTKPINIARAEHHHQQHRVFKQRVACRSLRRLLMRPPASLLSTPHSIIPHSRIIDNVGILSVTAGNDADAWG